ncbi:hypothetical protein H1R20_g7770, partial [Candolleomyces eurysporus]
MQLKPVSTSLSAPQLDNKRRFVGRGGSGSKQRSIKGKDVQRDAEGLAGPNSFSGEGTAEEEAGTIVRLPGRGGAGSRPRVVADGVVKGNSGLKLLWPRGKKARKLSGQSTTSPGHARQLSTESSASASTIQATTPSPPLPNPVTTADFNIDIDMASSVQKPSTSVHDRKPGNISKIARTMGELPPHMIYQQLLNKKHPTSLPKLDTDSYISSSSSITSNPPSGSPRNSKPKRNSLSLPYHLGPASGSSSTSSFVRSSAMDHGRESLAPSQRTVSTCGTLSDLHRFALADDLSESWGEIRDDSYNDSPSSESPITFSPPTPIVERPHSSILSYRDSITSTISSTPGFPATVNHAVMSDTESPAGVSSSSSSSSSSLASSHGPRPALSLSFGSTRGLESSRLEQDASEEGDVKTPVNVRSGTSSAATTGVSESPLPPPSGPTSAATAVSKEQHLGNVKSHDDSSSSPSHRPKPSLTSLSSTASSEIHATRPDTPFGDYGVPHTPYTPPASKRRWSITTGPYDDGKDLVIIASSRTSATSVSDSQGWSGEWNTKLPDVIQALRLL